MKTLSQKITALKDEMNEVLGTFASIAEKIENEKDAENLKQFKQDTSKTFNKVFEELNKLSLQYPNETISASVDNHKGDKLEFNSVPLDDKPMTDAEKTREFLRTLNF